MRPAARRTATLALALIVTLLGLPSSLSRSAEAERSRPPAHELRDSLERILDRREYRQARSLDAAAELQRRLLDRLVELLARLARPLAGLHETNKALFYALTIGLSLLLLALVGHIVLTARAGLLATQRARLRKQREPQVRTESDPDRLRRTAAELARRGEFLEAIRTTYSALIRHLDRRELLRYDPTRTNWEYVAQVRRFPEVLAVLQPFSSLLDRKCYGGEPASEADWQASLGWLEQAARQGETAP